MVNIIEYLGSLGIIDNFGLRSPKDTLRIKEKRFDSSKRTMKMLGGASRAEL